MISNNGRGPAESNAPALVEQNEIPLSRWRKFRMIVKVVELRLRFVVLMAGTALVFAYWDELWNRYDKWMRPTALERAATSGIEYYCPMHPQVVQDEHGNCPICGMTLASRKKGEKADVAGGCHGAGRAEPVPRGAGRHQDGSGRYSPLVETVKTVGYVAFDERRMANIVSKVPGKSRVEKLHVNFNGQDVEVGQTLAELYSPELNQAIQELINASERAGAGGRAAVGGGAVAGGRSGSDGACLGREAQAMGDHSGSDRRDPQEDRQDATSRSRSFRRCAGTCSRRTWSRARR